MAASDEAVQQFVSVTAASVEEARRYIELCGGSVDQAVNMFWDAPLPSGQSTPGTCPRTGPPHASGEEECGAALRFRLKPRAANRREFHRVRAPIASKHDVLVEGPSDSLMARFGVSASGEYKTPASEPAFSRGGVSNGRDLASLFAPPEHLMVHGPFEMAKAMGQSANKWVIANLQDPSTFECHMLNRDTWKDEGVGALLSEHFMLWQQNHDHADAQRVISLYMLPESVEYPVLLIIDPVTGAELHRSCGMVEPQAMISKLLKFLEQHKAPIPDPAPAQASVGSKGSKRPRSSAGATAVVKQAKAARAALAQAAASSVHHKPAASAEDSEEYLYSSDEEGAASSPSPGVVEDLCSEADSDADVVAVPSKSHQPDALAVEALATATIPKACVLEKEPGKGPESTRIQLRLPDGKRFVRRFPSSSSVSEVYAVAAARIGQPHTLATRHSLQAIADGRCTAEEAGLAEAITPAAARAALEKPLRPLQAEAFDLRSTFPSASLESSASKSLQDADLLNSSIVVNAR